MLLGASVALLDDRETDSLVLGERDQRLVLLAQNEDVGGQSGPDVSTAVADLNDLGGSGVRLPGDDDTDTANVATTSGHAEVADGEGNEGLDLTSGQVDLNDVVDTDVGVGVADGAAIVGADEGDASGEKTDLLNLAELEGSLLREDSVKDEATLGVIQQTEVLISAANLDGIHEASREGSISAHLTVNRDETLHEDESHLTTGQGIPESVAQEDHQRQALAKLVGTSVRTRSLFNSNFHTISSHQRITQHHKHPVSLGSQIPHSSTFLLSPLASLRTKTPLNLSSIQCWGAFRRLRWCLGPRGYKTIQQQSHHHHTLRQSPLLEKLTPFHHTTHNSYHHVPF